ncbi:hypothetical protein [Streptomyces sp. NPDC098101]|uniref:hypothetical protein n=1 Tax=Streptomyces sp. NPDC098101 TaxID=3366096 RepID=UPI0038230137
MDRLSLADLRTVDERVLPFNPYGFGGRLSPEDALEFQQHVIAQYELADEVADGTRQRFEQLRHVYRYGVLCYDLFTMVGDAALLAFEQALRDRFINFHEGEVSLRTKEGEVHVLKDVTDYGDFVERYKELKGTRIQMGPDRSWIGFNGTLDGLYRWARREGLLRGQRNRGREKAITSLRNMVAHPSSFHLHGPVEAARTLSNLAEVINRLWGQDTPGGRLYPAPVERRTTAIAWNPATGSVSIGHAENLRSDTDEDEWQYVIVQAVFEPGTAEDPTIFHFDTLFEHTTYSCDLLWGPGNRAEALQWLDSNPPRSDTCDYLDRVFLIRHDVDTLYTPQRPEIAAGLPEAEHSGTWYAIRADAPADAFAHVRASVEDIESRHQRSGECRQCHADTLRKGTLREALTAAQEAGANVEPLRPPDSRVPGWMPRSITVPITAST